MKDRFTPKERIGAFLGGKPIDRVPCVPLILNHAARLIGESVYRHATDGAVMGRAHVAAYRRYGQDLITIFSDTANLAEAMGTKLKYPDDDVPRVDTPVVREPDDVKKLRPIDVRTAGRLHVCLEAIRHCVREVGGEVFVSCCFSAPFTTAAGLRGTATIARDTIRNPKLAHEILDASLKAVNDFSSAVVEAGGIPVLVDPVASGSVLSRGAFEEFALPGIRSAFEHIRSLGSVPILHICGRTTTIIDLMAQSGAAVLSIDQMDLREAKERVGKQVCLMGNVRPAQTLLGGTPESVRAEAEKCLADAGDSPGGFILASGCEVPIESPQANVAALIDVARNA
jgi:uroporphyrinogen decarboxylase